MYMYTFGDCLTSPLLLFLTVSRFFSFFFFFFWRPPARPFRWPFQLTGTKKRLPLRHFDHSENLGRHISMDRHEVEFATATVASVLVHLLCTHEETCDLDVKMLEFQPVEPESKPGRRSHSPCLTRTVLMYCITSANFRHVCSCLHDIDWRERQRERDR